MRGQRAAPTPGTDEKALRLDHVARREPACAPGARRHRLCRKLLLPGAARRDPRADDARRAEEGLVFRRICTIASVAGGALGYAFGALFYDTIGQWLINLYGYGEKMEALRAFYAQWGAIFILVKGFTPIPFKLVTIVSGLLAYNFPLFIVLSMVTRGARFFVLAAAINRFWRCDPLEARKPFRTFHGVAGGDRRRGLRARGENLLNRPASFQSCRTEAPIFHCCFSRGAFNVCTTGEVSNRL